MLRSRLLPSFGERPIDSITPADIEQWRQTLGPILFCTCRPSGSRYFAYQTGPRLRSTRKTCPDGSLSVLTRRIGTP